MLEPGFLGLFDVLNCVFPHLLQPALNDFLAGFAL